MIFLANAEGTITAVVPSPIYEGSSNANEFILIAPFPSSSVVSVSIKLPNGVKLEPYLSGGYKMQNLEDFSGKIQDASGHRYNAWSLLVDYNITEVKGDLHVQFIIVTGTTASGKPIIQTTNDCIIPVEGGEGYLPPDYSESDWNAILAALQAARLAATRAENAAALMEWDYAITNIEALSTEQFQKFATEKGDSPFSVIVKDVSGVLDDNDIVTLPATCSHIHFSNCKIYAHIYAGAKANAVGNVVLPAETVITGFKGMVNPDETNCSSISYFKKVEDCSACRVYNCQTVLNSRLHQLRTGAEGFYFERADNITLTPYGNLPVSAVYIYSLSQTSEISNVIFIANKSGSFTGGYYTIAGARGLSNVTARGISSDDKIRIRYANCTFASPFTCQDYAANVVGKVPFLTNDGSLDARDVYTEDEADEKFVTKDEASSVFDYKGSVERYADLPTSGNEVGDVYNVENETTIDGKVYAAGTNFAWDGTKWDPLGGDFSTVAFLQNATFWDHVITKVANLNSEYLATLSGNVLIKDIDNTTGNYPRNISINSNISTLGIFNCDDLDGYTFTSTVGAKVKLIMDNTRTFNSGDINIVGFYEVCGADGGYVNISNCFYVHDCRVFNISNCDFVTRINGYATITDCKSVSNWFDARGTVTSCKAVSNVFVDPGTDITTVQGRLTITNCQQVRNINKGERSSITYTNCTYVDGFSCADYYGAEDVGKVPVITADGSSQVGELGGSSGDYTALEQRVTAIENDIGDISTILTLLHEGGI